jgi:peptidoglycan/xylan/chitin deacetylase (PgdA/CDA1 family)
VRAVGGRWAQAMLGLGLGLVGAAAGRFGPSVVSLGQWTNLRALPGGWCRWRGPDLTTVALTFDDGPCPEGTPVVLDALDRLGLSATFFCLGAEVARHPGLVTEIRRRGHLVASHGYRHDHHFARSARWVRSDLQAATEVLGQEGVSPRWFRPPFGQTPGTTLLEAHRQGLGVVLWSAWGREWVAASDASSVANRIIGHLGGGDVVLLHDSDRYSSPGTVARAVGALEPIADELRRRRLRAVTLDELMSPTAIFGSAESA